MRNLTLAIEEEVLLAARRLALDRDTTVNQLIRDYLRSLIEQDGRRKAALDRLRNRMTKGVLEVGDRNWTREDLYER